MHISHDLLAIQTKYPKLDIDIGFFRRQIDHKGIVFKIIEIQEAVDFLEEDYQSGTSN